jgi:peptidoglycan hydrolase-like protein with peptidoglycan-binding domain
MRFQGLPMVGLGVAMVLLSPMSVLAERSQDYTPIQWISVLNGLGYPVALTDAIDAPNVSQAIRDFQLQNNLPVTGTPTPASQDVAAALMRDLQQNLNRSLKPAVLLPGSQYYGTQTEALVKQFQERNRLPVTGIATLETRRRLQQELQLTAAVPATPGAGSSVIPPVAAPILPAPVPVGLPGGGPSVLPPIVSPRPAPEPIIAPVAPVMPPSTTAKFGTIYTEPEMRRMLQGIGYDIHPQKFLSDPSAVVALQDFQIRYGLAITGTADQPTQEMARKILRVLQYNLRLVVDRQLSLTEYYDAPTEQAVRNFQRRQQLRVDGLATVSVRQAIDTAARKLVR